MAKEYRNWVPLADFRGRHTDQADTLRAELDEARAANSALSIRLVAVTHDRLRIAQQRDEFDRKLSMALSVIDEVAKIVSPDTVRSMQRAQWCDHHELRDCAITLGAIKRAHAIRGQ